MSNSRWKGIINRLYAPVKYLYWYHYLVIFTSLFITLFAWQTANENIKRKRSELFEIQSEQLLAQISERMSHYEVALKASASAIQHLGQDITFEGWSAFSKTLNLTKSYPGINGVGVIFYVPKDRVQDFLFKQRKSRANFSIYPENVQQEYWPITYIEPVNDNKQAIGLNIAFEANRLKAAKQARDRAETKITAPIVLVQDEQNTPGFLQFIPFYNSDDTTSIEKRRRHFVGHVYATFIMHKLLEGTLSQNNRQVLFSISDGDDNLYNELNEQNEHYDKAALLTKTITLDMFSRKWTFNIETALSFKRSTDSSLPLLILYGGIIIDIVLVFIFIILSRSRQKALALAHTLSIKEEYYRYIIESAPCGIIITDSEGVIENINPQTQALFAYTSKELVGKKIDILVPKRFQKDHPKHRNSFYKKPSHRQMGIGREVFGLTKKGTEFPAEIGLAQFNYEDSVKTLATIIDMSEHEHITKELIRSNRELNNFAYVASHDLKAPLRGIMQLSSWIEEDIAAFATDETKHNLSLLMQRTSRLEKLLEDLLTYSKVGHKLGDIKTVNVESLLLNIFDLQNPDKDISMIFDKPLPIITSYVTPLETIFRNLIGNAIKHRKKEGLVISISAKELPTYYQFSVKDNGPGIPEKHHSKIFELFKTLQPRDEVEGSGMGLSIIKKLLENQNCFISVDSDGQNGSCFTFTWPKQNNIEGEI